MRARPLLVMSVIALLLLGYILLVERDRPTTDERTEREKKVLTLERDEVRAVVVRRGADEVRLARVTDAAGGDSAGGSGSDTAGDSGDTLPAAETEWRLEAPFATRADRAAVDTLLDRLLNLEKERTLEDLDREAAGFERRAAVIVETAGGETELEIGPPVPASSSMLVAVEGESDVYQVSDALWSELEREAGEWRTKEVFPGGRADVARLRLESTGEPLILARHDDGFRLESPLVDRADKDRVDALLGALTGLRVERFVDLPEGAMELASWGLEPPVAAVEAMLEGRERPFRVELGGPAADEEGGEGGLIYARAGEQVFTARSELATFLEGVPGDWRSRDWASLPVFRVDRASFVDAAGEVELERVDADWRRDGERVDFTVASDLLYAVTEIKADAVLDRADVADLAPAELEIVLEATDTSGDEDVVESERLSLHPATAGGYLAAIDGRDALLRLDPEAVASLRQKLGAVRVAVEVPP